MVYPVSYQGYNAITKVQYPCIFRGWIIPNSQLPRLTQPSFTALQTPSGDVVQVSAGSKIKESVAAEKSGMSKGAKWALGILGTAAAIYGVVVGHRMLTKPSIEKVAKDFSEIFRRDVSKDEAEKLVKKYEELLNIEDTEQFCKKAFEEVKKDYGYENIPITLKINKVKDMNGAGDAGWDSERGILGINLLTDKFSGKVFKKNRRGRKCELQKIIHEFQHVKQHEIAYRTSRDGIAEAIHENRGNMQNIKENLQSLLNGKKYKLEQKAKEMNLSVEELRKSLEGIIKDIDDKKIGNIPFDKNIRIALDDFFEKLPILDKDSQEYKLGLKYIENTKNYVRAGNDRKGYRSQILENEAENSEKIFEEIYNYFASPYRIPWVQ